MQSHDAGLDRALADPEYLRKNGAIPDNLQLICTRISGYGWQVYSDRTVDFLLILKWLLNRKRTAGIQGGVT